MNILILILLCLNPVHSHLQTHYYHHSGDKSIRNKNYKYEDENLNNKREDQNTDQNRFSRYHINAKLPDSSKFIHDNLKPVSSRYNHDNIIELVPPGHHDNKINKLISHYDIIQYEPVFSRHHPDVINKSLSSRHYHNKTSKSVSFQKKISNHLKIKHKSYRVRAVEGKYQEQQSVRSKQRNNRQYEKDFSKSNMVKHRPKHEDSALIKVKKMTALQLPALNSNSTLDEKLNNTVDLDRIGNLFWLKMILIIIPGPSLLLILLLVISGCCSSTRHKKSYAYHVVSTAHESQISTFNLSYCKVENKVCNDISAVDEWRNFASNDMTYGYSANKNVKPDKRMFQACACYSIGEVRKCKHQTKKNAPHKVRSSSELNSGKIFHPKQMSSKIIFGGNSECTFNSHAISRSSKKYDDFDRKSATNHVNV